MACKIVGVLDECRGVIPAANSPMSQLQHRASGTVPRHGHDMPAVATSGTDSDQTTELQAGLARLAAGPARGRPHVAVRLRNYFLTGVVIAGPIALTFYITWRVFDSVDSRVRLLFPLAYQSDSKPPFALPGLGLLFAFVAVTLIGALVAPLFGRSLFSAGEMMLMRVPIVRNVYRGLQDIFSSALVAAGHNPIAQKVVLVQFPSEGIWSLAFITGDAAAAIKAPFPSDNLISIFIPHGLVPPSGITCFVRRKDLIPTRMRVEDAAKIIFSAGMARPAASPTPSTAAATAVRSATENQR
jgi:uncharacterized membrane protein